MPLTSAFTPPGHFAFSSRPSHGESIYRTLRDNFGGTFDVNPNGLQQARLYAQAMCLASAQYQIDRAANNRQPLKATELLGVVEKDYQVVPSPRSTMPERRSYLSAVQKVTRGARREAIEDSLRTLLGSDFIEYRTTARADIVAGPLNPGSVGVFAARGAKKKVFKIDTAVTVIGVPVTVPITILGGTDAPQFGETYCVDPDPRRAIEQITIAAVGGGTITATFSNAHEPGTAAARPHPVWFSYQRYDKVIVTPAAALDAEKRRKINEVMRRALRGVSQWCIALNAVGFFTAEDPVLGRADCVPVQ